MRRSVVNSKQIYRSQHIFKVFEAAHELNWARNNQRNRGIFNGFNLRWACKEILPGFHLIWFIACLNWDSLKQQTIQSHGMNGFGIRCQLNIPTYYVFECMHDVWMCGRDWWELNHSITLERNVMDIRLVASAVYLGMPVQNAMLSFFVVVACEITHEKQWKTWGLCDVHV